MVYKMSPLRAKEVRAAKAQMGRWYPLGRGAGEPWFVTPRAPFGLGPKARAWIAKHQQIILYAAILGRQRGLLPEHAEEFSATAWWQGAEGKVTFWKKGMPEIVIELRHLEMPAEAEPILEAA